MGCLAQGFDENPEGIRASEIVELRFLEAIGGVEWGRMESDVAEAEQLAQVQQLRLRKMFFSAIFQFNSQPIGD